MRRTRHATIDKDTNEITFYLDVLLVYEKLYFKKNPAYFFRAKEFQDRDSVPK